MKKYPKYKDSGVEWLGEIPSDWSTWKVSRLFKKIGSGTTPKAGTPMYYEDGTIPWINTGDLNNGYISDCSSYITQKAFDDHSALKIYEEGTLLVAMYGATIGKIAITKFEACTNQACCSLVSSKRINTKFAFYWFIANKENIINLSYGGGQPNISQDIVRSLKIPICDVSEQLSIVQFLDHKTDRIDRFIANRQKQIELLKEQKAGIINKAVTKGIGSLSVNTERSRSGVETPNVKMKDSGIEWIGEVYNEWELQKLKYLCSHISISAIIKEQDDTYIALENIESWTGKFLFNQEYSGFDSTVKKFTDKDILFGKLRPYLAKVAKPDFKGVCVSEILVLRPIKLLREYLYFILINADFIDFISQTSEGTKMPRTSWSKMADLKFPFPSKEVQQSILNFIKEETSTIDTLISKYQKQIDLMQEYRTALISQAVTGKIDVRGWKPKAKKHTPEAMPVGMAAEEN